MNREQAKELLPIILHFSKGGDVEKERIVGVWFLDANPLFDRDWNYRIAIRKPSINWDHVAPVYKWLTVDWGDSLGFLHMEEPVKNITNNRWYGNKDKVCIPANQFSSFKPGSCDWKDSLVERPTEN